MTFRFISGVVGLGIFALTILLALNLLAMKPGAKVLLAGYMGIGGILFGAYLMFYAITGKWRPNLANRKKGR